jgi:hypothetical protein
VQSLGRRDPDDHGPRYATVVLGERRVDDDWEPLDEQPVVGIIFDETDAATGHGIEVGLTYAEDDDSAIDPVFGLGPADVEVETMEFYVGWRRTFRQAEQGLHPYVSAGATGVRTSVDVSAGGLHEQESDMEPGVYVRAGLLWDLGPTLRCGLDYRYVLVDEHTLGGMEIDSSFDQVLLTFGWAF